MICFCNEVFLMIIQSDLPNISGNCEDEMDCNELMFHNEFIEEFIKIDI